MLLREALEQRREAVARALDPDHEIAPADAHDRDREPRESAQAAPVGAARQHDARALGKGLEDAGEVARVVAEAVHRDDDRERVLGRGAAGQDLDRLEGRRGFVGVRAVRAQARDDERPEEQREGRMDDGGASHGA